MGQMRSGALALGLLAALALSGPSAEATAATVPALAQAGATVTAVPTSANATPTPTPPPGNESLLAEAAASATPTPASAPATVTPVAPSATAQPASAPATVTPVATPMPPGVAAGPASTSGAAGPVASPGSASAASAPGSTASASVSVTPTSSTPTDSTAADPFRDREDRMALMVGRARVTAGLLPLARSAELDRAAIAHAQNMVAHAYMDHDGPDGSPVSRAAAQGYTVPSGSAWLVVETISAISDEPDGALGWWLSDALHRRVLMHGFWRELGVGYVQGGPYGRFWVALFGCRPNVLPPVLLDGMLDIPTESCGKSADAFGAVQSVRVGESPSAAQGQNWTDYTAQESWPAGHPAVVDLRDASGDQLEAHAADPTGAAAQSP
ncbi:MAG: hypothetical protein JO352_26475 [Chloroflexi bacterium]|nr:hypothetical protein [Chloroflexota bacterium]